ncbi:MAG: hypothetical protein AB7E55_01190 [Pigmentiphaga sp.]
MAIEIRTLEELNNVRNDLEASYILMADIDASETATWNGGAGWVPIGNSSNRFKGTFDGNGHKIFGLTVNRPRSDHQGLFGYTSGAVLKNITLEEPYVRGNWCVGALAGSGWAVSITGCRTTGAAYVAGSNHPHGGLVGVPGATIIACHTVGTMGGWGSYRGGLVGYYTGDEIRDCSSSVSGSCNGLIGIMWGATVTNCTASGSANRFVGEVGGDATFENCSALGTGGFVYQTTRGTFKNCKATGPATGGGFVAIATGGRFENCTAFGDVSGGDDVGGFVGKADSTSVQFIECSALGNVSATGYRVGGFAGQARNARFYRCYATGKVSSSLSCVGGFCGYVTYSSTTIPRFEDCYAWGDVSGSNHVGGLLGYLYNNTQVVRCYSIGRVTTPGANFGGLIGYRGSGVTVESCYYDKDTSGQSDDDGRGTPKTTAEMKQEATFAGWDFDAVWHIIEGKTYPTFRLIVLEPPNLYGLLLDGGYIDNFDRIDYSRRIGEANEIVLTIKYSDLQAKGLSLSDLDDCILQRQGISKERARVQTVELDGNMVTIRALTGEIDLLELQTPPYWRGWNGMDLADVFRDLARGFITKTINTSDGYYESMQGFEHLVAENNGIRLATDPDTGDYLSEGHITLEFDIGANDGIEWIRWGENRPGFTSVAVQYRTYDGAAWGAWSSRASSDEPDVVGIRVEGSPSHEKIQVRIYLLSGTGENTPLLTGVQVIARTAATLGLAGIPEETGIIVRGTEFNLKTHLDAAVELAEKYDFEFKVGVDSDITLTEQLGSDLSDQLVLIDAENASITRLTRRKDRIINRLYCLGAGSGAGQLQLLLEDEESQSANGIYPGVYENKNATTLEELQELGQAYLDANKEAYWEAQVEFMVTDAMPDFAVGDTVRVISRRHEVDFTGRILDERRIVGAAGETAVLNINYVGEDILRTIFRNLERALEFKEEKEAQVPVGVFSLVAAAKKNAVELTWAGSADWFNIYGSVTGAEGYTRVAVTEDNKYTHSDLQAGTEYFYAVAPVVNGIEGSLVGPVSATPLGAEPPPPVVEVEYFDDSGGPAVPDTLLYSSTSYVTKYSTTRSEVKWHDKSWSEAPGIQVVRATAKLGCVYPALGSALLNIELYDGAGRIISESPYWKDVWLSPDSNGIEVELTVKPKQPANVRRLRVSVYLATRRAPTAGAYGGWTWVSDFKIYTNKL